MAAQGLRDMGDGREQVANAEEVRALKRRALRLNLLTVGSALAATLLVALASR